MSTPTAQPTAYGRSLKENRILASTPEQLIVQLYEAALRHLAAGERAIAEHRIEAAHHALRRGERIIQYLDGIVNDEAGELAAQLHGIYGFALAHLNEARIELDPAKVATVCRVLGRLHQAWAQIAGP